MATGDDIMLSLQEGKRHIFDIIKVYKRAFSQYYEKISVVP